MEDEYDLSLKHLFGNFFYYKLFFIPSVILFPCLLFIEVYRNYYYIFFSIFTSLLILTWNFPMISRFIYSRPIYFEDLNKQLKLDNNEEKKNIIYDIENSDKFKTKFILFQQFIISVVIALTADYIKSRFYDNQDDQISTFAIIGVIGGLLSLMVKVIKLLGKITLIIIYKQKKKVELNQSDNQNILISDDLNNNIII
jgi:hypothetical protein